MTTELEKTLELAESMEEWVFAFFDLLLPYLQKQLRGEPVTPAETALVYEAFETNASILAAYREWQATRP